MATSAPALPIAADLRPLTFEDYRALPEDGPRCELINGELFMAPSPKMMHQFVVGQLFSRMHEYASRYDLGLVLVAPFGVRFSRYTVVQPDIVFLSKERTALLLDDLFEGPPDLVVEVLSRSNRRNDLVRKMTLYAEHRVPEYWIIDPERGTLDAHRLHGDQYIAIPRAKVVESDSIAGLRSTVGELFEVPEWLRRPDPRREAAPE